MLVECESGVARSVWRNHPIGLRVISRHRHGRISVIGHRLGLGIAYVDDIAARRRRVSRQSESRHSRHQMLEYVALYALILHPVGGIGVAEHFKRLSLWSLLKLTHHACELAHRNPRVMMQIESRIGSEHTEIGVNRAVDLYVVAHQRSGLALGCIFLHLLDIVLHEGQLLEILKHLGCRGAYRGYVDENRALYLTPSALLHLVPVLKLRRHKRVRRHRNGGIVPVTHLYSRKRYIGYYAVYNSSRNGNPVAHAQHVVGRQLQSRHKAEN